MQQAQTQTQMTKPDGSPMGQSGGLNKPKPVQNKQVTPNKNVNSNVQPNPQKNVQMPAGGKHSKWWLWLLIGLVVGVLGTWLYYAFLA